MTLNLDDLEAAARAADYWGPWAIWRDLTDGGFVHVGNLEGVIPEGETVTPDDAEPNAIAKCYTPEIAEHIATFDPPTVVALIAKLREAEAVIERARGWTEKPIPGFTVENQMAEVADALATYKPTNERGE